MFSTRHSHRTTWVAKTLLLLGLFALIVGQAHACVPPGLQQSAGAFEQVASQPAAPGHGHEAAHSGHAHQAQPPDDCDEQQNAVAKSEPPRLLDGAAWPVAIHAMAGAWAIDRVAPDACPKTRISPPSVSVVLRFLRLTL